MSICSQKSCTGCGACASVCPKQCIDMIENSTGVIFPVINESACIGCDACKRVCPQINKVTYNSPKKAYAAWSADNEERRTSASGGIAAEIYKYALENGCYIVGAENNEDLSVSLRLTKDPGDIKRFKNSKYVFSTAYELYDELRELIKRGDNAVVVGTPCQIAAVRSIFKDNEHLILIDVVCHGVTPLSYLKQHVKHLEKEYNSVTADISYRDPDMGTSNYYFSLFDKSGKKFYSKRTLHGDTYQFGYHRAASYRENCFNCIYARGDRVSDITLSDYKGLGRLAPCGYDQTEVSCVLVNTDKGDKLINKLIADRRIIAEERPAEEPIQGDTQLQHPSLKTPKRRDFERYIQKYKGDFEKTMIAVMKRDRSRQKRAAIISKIGKIKRKLLK